MPILYSSKNNKINYMLENIQNITKEDAKFIIDVQTKYEFYPKQVVEMVRIVRLYVDPNQQNCATCGSSIRTAKDKIIVLYKKNKDLIDTLAVSDTIVVDGQTPDQTIDNQQSVEHKKVKRNKNK